MGVHSCSMDSGYSKIALSASEAKLRSLQDSLEHEQVARSHEHKQHSKLAEYSVMQLRKRVETPASFYDCESNLLANEYKRVLERCVRNSAADASLDRVVNPIESSVERQILARRLQESSICSDQLLNAPEGAYAPPVFSRGYPSVSAQASCGGRGSFLERARGRVLDASNSHNRWQNHEAYGKDVVCSQIKQTF